MYNRVLDSHLFLGNVWVKREIGRCQQRMQHVGVMNKQGNRTRHHGGSPIYPISYRGGSTQRTQLAFMGYTHTSESRATYLRKRRRIDKLVVAVLADAD